MSIGQRIKQQRELLGFSQEELAQKLGYKSRSTINKIESGINDISQSKVVEFAHALQTTPAYLMGWEGSSTQEQETNADSETIVYGPKSIAEKIKKVAKERKIPLKSVLENCGLSKNTLSSMQSGGSLPKSENLAKIADRLNVSVDYLLGRTDEAQLPAEDEQQFSAKERKVIQAYRDQPEMQSAVDRLLNIDD